MLKSQSNNDVSIRTLLDPIDICQLRQHTVLTCQPEPLQRHKH